MTAMDYTTFTDDGLLDELAHTVEQIASIKVQLSDDAADGQGDAGWRRRAKAALNFLARDQQLVNIELGRRKKARALAYERAFIDAARDLLDPEVYGTLIESAKRRIESGIPI